jgi:hypothetical protein
MAFRDDLTALAARHSALEHEVAHKTRELEQATRLLEEATSRSKLPVLDNIRVGTPCTAEWAAMTGDDRTRHCGDCKKTVYNLSNMTREEAQALIIEKNGRLCVRYFRRTDGTILVKNDCAVGVARKRRRRVIVASAAAILSGASAIAYQLVPESPRQQTLDAVELRTETESIGLRASEARPEPAPPPAAIERFVELAPPEEHLRQELGDMQMLE